MTDKKELPLNWFHVHYCEDDDTGVPIWLNGTCFDEDDNYLAIPAEEAAEVANNQRLFAAYQSAVKEFHKWAKFQCECLALNALANHSQFLIADMFTDIFEATLKDHGINIEEPSE